MGKPIFLKRQFSALGAQYWCHMNKIKSPHEFTVKLPAGAHERIFRRGQMNDSQIYCSQLYGKSKIIYCISLAPMWSKTVITLIHTYSKMKPFNSLVNCIFCHSKRKMSWPQHRQVKNSLAFFLIFLITYLKFSF